MTCPKEQEHIESIHGFNYLDFISLTGKEDFFSPAAVAPVPVAVAEPEPEPEPVTVQPVASGGLRGFAGKVIRKLRSV
jgi:hypothetical protein